MSIGKLGESIMLPRHARREHPVRLGRQVDRLAGLLGRGAVEKGNSTQSIGNSMGIGSFGGYYLCENP